MPRSCLSILILILCGSSFILSPSVVCAQDAAAGIDATQVRESIERGVRYLRDRQDKRTGSWSEQTGFPEGGISALCTLALLNSGISPDDPLMVRALDYVRKPKGDRRTYSVALETMVLCAATPEMTAC
jgi:soluble lytic murein transglycosylase-like protein